MLSAEEARLKAVEKIVEGFFDGSPEALVAHLSSQASPDSKSSQRAAVHENLSPVLDDVDAPATPVAQLQTQNLDQRLL
jgi:hypothetical protein